VDQKRYGPAGARVYELTAAGRKQLGVEESRWLAANSAINRALRTV
jgi:hypothetical protein